LSSYDFDLFTIGAGSGGVRASRLAASFGARVAVAEKRNLGGTCVNLGCIPKKLFSYAGHFREDFEDSVAYGWDTGVPRFDWGRLIQNKNAEIARLNGIYQKILTDAGVTIFEGHAKLVDPHTLDIGGKHVTAERILIATGGRAIVPDIPGHNLLSISDYMFHLEKLPERMVVVGGGYIAVEFASIMNGLGSKVTLVHRAHNVLRGFDEDVRSVLTDALASHGIELHLLETVRSVKKIGEGMIAHLAGGASIETELVLCAIGREPNTGSLGLENAGVELGERGAILVDDDFRTNVPHIYALGDVIDRVRLTPMALVEANAFAQSVFGGILTRVDYGQVPTAVFTSPPVACVGMTEADAIMRFGKVDVYVSRFRPLRATISGRPDKTMMKLVVEPESDRVLGAHMVGTDAPEIIQGIAVAVRVGATKADFDRTISIHPTSAEEFMTMRTKTVRGE
jgi:glutathione reductase (NADPH)